MNTDVSIPMLHVSALAITMDLLKEIGAPLTPGLLAAQLPTRIVDQRDGYVPFRSACTWINREARHQGVDNLGLRAFRRAGSNAVPVALRDTILAAPTLYQGICTWADLIHRESSHVACWVDDGGKDLCLRFSSTFAQDVPGQSDWIWSACMLHLMVVRLFLGPDWSPKEMVVPHYGIGLAAARALMPDTRFIQDPKITGLSIPRELLSARPFTAAAAPPVEELPSPPESLESALAELVRLRLPDGAPRLDEAAEVAGMSVRTLQRRLAEQRLSYEQLVSNMRFELGRQMLDQGKLPIGEIAHVLGYANATHFARAFRRIAGMSPREYRRQSKQ